MFIAPRREMHEYLAQVPDARGLQGRRHVLTATLTDVVCALLQKCRGFEAIGQWLQEVPLDFCWTPGSGRQVFRVTRNCDWTDRETGENRTSHEVVCGITDLTRAQANVPHLLQLNRGQ